MVASFGELAVWLAWLISGVAMVVGYSVPGDGVRGKRNRAIHRAEFLWSFLWSLSIASFALIVFAFCSLVYVFLVSDFSVWLVMRNSHQYLPWYYKMGAAWGNHEGSMLLWVLVLSLLAAALWWLTNRELTQTIVGDKKNFRVDIARFANLSPTIARAVATQQLMVFLFSAYMLFTSNPFLRLDMPANSSGDAAAKGMDLNPLLQDPGLIFHPPTLYGGFVGLSAIFSIAVGMMLNGRRVQITPPALVRLWRFFILLAFVFLTAGIVGGSFWAYYELGWGGFWFWDPVENISLIPWLLSVALLHAIMVYGKTGQLKMSCLLLSILTFSTSLVGTFLVRSGLITSVHSFANDPSRGIFMLLVVGFLVTAGLIIWLRYYYRFSADAPAMNLFSRHGLLVINNMIFYIIAGIIFLGLIYPLCLAVIIGEQIAVGAPFFNITVLPFFGLLGLLLAAGFFLPDNNASAKKNIAIAWQRTKPLLIIAVAIGFLVGVTYASNFLMVCGGFALSCWLLLVAGRDAMVKIKNGITAMAAPLAHAGFGLVIMGVVGTTGLNTHQDFLVQDQSHFSFKGQDFKVDKIYFEARKHFNSLTVRLVGGDMVLLPEKRIYLVGGQESNEVAIHSNFFVNYYAAIGEIDKEKKQLMIRFYYQPLVMFIFLGAVMMAMSGVVATFHRRRYGGIKN
ncbi:MAG: cytochrome c-type biogenesis CcmF C-terminal domain-containing protein [Hydrotalea sp.]|nr:cytochrome c-type biogenesis CcmF C-terminal domain-containing protein [Hydrotalea sp.]